MINEQILWELQAGQQLAECTAAGVDPPTVTGRLLAISAELMLLHIFSHEMGQFNGYCLLDRENITALHWGDRRMRQWERQLRQLPGMASETPEPEVNLMNMETAIRSLAEQHLLTFYRDDAESGLVIGKVVEIYGESLLMEVVNYGGQRDGFMAILTSEIARVDFGGRYEQNLEILSGFKPAPEEGEGRPPLQ